MTNFILGIICLALGAALMWFGGQIATDGWKKWHSSNKQGESLGIQTERNNNHYIIDPLLSGHLTAIDLLSSTATINFVTDVRTIQLQKTLFSIKYEDFSFSLGFKNGTIILNRCNNLINHRIRSTNPIEKIRIRIVFEPDKMGLLVGDNILFAELAKLSDPQEKNTFLLSQYSLATFPPVYPPNSMLKWIRKEELIPVTEYTSFGELSDSVASMIVSIENKIKDSNMYFRLLFWNLQRFFLVLVPKN